LTLVYMVSLIP